MKTAFQFRGSRPLAIRFPTCRTCHGARFPPPRGQRDGRTEWPHPGLGRRCSRRAYDECCCKSLAWHPQLDRCSFAQLACQPQRSTMLGHKAIHHRQSQTTAFAGGLRREEWLCRTSQRCFVHAAASVGDGEQNVVARVQGKGRTATLLVP